MVSMKRFGCALVETMLALHLPRRPFTAGRHLRHLGVEIRRLGAPASAACNSDNSGVCQGRAEHVRHPQAGQHAERRRSGRKHPPKTTFPSTLTYPERAFASQPGDPGSLTKIERSKVAHRRVFPLIAMVQLTCYGTRFTRLKVFRRHKTRARQTYLFWLYTLELKA